MRIRPNIEVTEKVGDAPVGAYYRVAITLDGKEIVAVEHTHGSAGMDGTYDFPGEIHCLKLNEVVRGLIKKAGDIAEISRVYIVASSMASAEWAWKDHIKGGTGTIISDDLDFIETEAKYESLRYRQRKGEDSTEPDHYHAYAMTVTFEKVESKENKDG